MFVQVSLEGKPHPPAMSSRYLRSLVLDRYENSTWKNLQGNDRFSQAVSSLPPLSATRQAECVRHSIQLMGSTQMDLVTPYPTVALTLPPNMTVGISRNLEFLLKNLPRPLGRMSYETLSFPQPLSADQCAFLRRLRPEENEKATAGPGVLLPPSSQQRTLALATSWCADLLRRREAQDAPSNRLNLQIAERLARRLQADYDYTLDLRDANPHRDGVEDFLFYTRQGNCEYFASSLAVMCELLNVPARVAVGFVLDEYDPDAERYIVRDRDAHAWCEVLSDSADWRIVDPTPASARLEYKKRKWYTSFTDFLQEMRFLWYQNVVGYDFVRQREIVERASDRALGTWARLQIALKDLKASLVNLLIHGEVDRILVNFMLLLQAVTAAVLLVFVIRGIQHHRRRRLTPSLSRRLTLLDRLLALLERRGLDLRPEQTLREQAGRAVERFSLPEAPLRELTELQYRWRWGGRAPTAQELRRAGEAFDFLCEAISARGRT
jgi:transglutaminase-like putative cysteine protease